MVMILQPKFFEESVRVATTKWRNSTSPFLNHIWNFLTTQLYTEFYGLGTVLCAYVFVDSFIYRFNQIKLTYEGSKRDKKQPTSESIQLSSRQEAAAESRNKGHNTNVGRVMSASKR